jgi:hypothetical protein
MRMDNITVAVPSVSRKRWDRGEATELLAEFESAQDLGVSEREFAEERGVARSTLRSWSERKAGLDGDPALVEFFESPSGLAFIHRLVTLLHLIFCQAGPCGVDRVCQFLKMSGLAAFVGSSHGSQQQVSVAMRREILEFEQVQHAKLSPGMRERPIVIAADETWLNEMCLVGMDTRSNYILVEEYADSRDGETWQTVVERALKGLRVKVVGIAADEGAGLGRLIHTLLGVQKAPDVLHVQRDLWKALGQANRLSLLKPAEAMKKAAADLERWLLRHANHMAGERGVGRPPDFERHIASAEDVLLEAASNNACAVHEAQAVEDAIRTLSTAYHPVDLETGAVRSARSIHTAFDQAIATIDAAVERLGIPSSGRERIAKAKRVLPKMIDLATFFFSHIERCLEPLDLSSEVKDLIRDALVPAFYLQQVAHRGRNAPERDHVLQLGRTLLEQARNSGSAFAALPPALRQNLETLAADCASLFVRATSCTEGRNGQLALMFQGQKRLNGDRLAVLRTLHNYFIRRPDGTTAAERFFEQEHDDLLEWLLDRIDHPVRPRTSRTIQRAA